MLDTQHEVWFQSANDPVPRKVRMLLFDQAIHLYDATDESFLGAYSFKFIRFLSSTVSEAVLKLLPDSADQLTVSTHHLLWPELNNRLTSKSGLRSFLSGRWKWPMVFLLVTGFLIGLYFLLVTIISSVSLQLVSEEKEKQLGEMIYQNMMAGLSIDTVAGRKLKHFADQLRLSDSYKLHYTVINEKEINAFAIPGGYIVVYKGILEEMQQPEELVALLGHEATHVNERHSLRSILRQLSGTVLLSMVFGDLGSIGAVVVNQADQIRSLSYSRALEEEADKKAMDLMQTNQVDPRGMIGLMDRLKKAEGAGSLPGFLSTHPLTNDRKKAAAAYIRQFPGEYPTPPTLLESWQELKKHIKQPGPGEW